MTYDAKFVYEDIAKGVLGDWQSPVMTVLWGMIDPIAPGAASMFLLIATSYWLGFGLLAFALARRASRLALLLPLLALLPPAFVFVGIIWRDVLFATSWLLAAAIAFAAAERERALSGAGAGAGACAVRLRRAAASERADRRADPRRLHCLAGANVRGSAPRSCSSRRWRDYLRWCRWSITARSARRGSIRCSRSWCSTSAASAISPSENQFPVNWSEPETAMLLNGCYQPTQWDIYWRLEPCDFVMRKIEREQKLFGTPAITEAWARAVMRHPVAYLQHRAAFMWNFLAGDNLTMWVADVEHPSADGVSGSPGLRRAGLRARHG